MPLFYFFWGVNNPSFWVHWCDPLIGQSCYIVHHSLLWCHTECQNFTPLHKHMGWSTQDFHTKKYKFVIFREMTRNNTVSCIYIWSESFLCYSWQFFGQTKILTEFIFAKIENHTINVALWAHVSADVLKWRHCVLCQKYL